MKITVQIKLLPTIEQSKALMDTIFMVNTACNRLSQLAWVEKEFRRFPLQKTFYHQIRSEFDLTAQIVCLLNGKVADAYKLDKKKQRIFRIDGSIAYDNRVLKINTSDSIVNIWTVFGRKKIPFTCGENQRKLLAYPRRESDLFHRRGKWFLNVTIDVPEDKEIEATDALGVDFGIVNIASDSDGKNYSGSKLNKIRNRNRSLRRKLQIKGTKSAKRLLKKWSGRESRFARDTNHVISKCIVQTAKRTGRAIAIENLKGIRDRIRARRRQRARLHSWAFAQLGGFITYKAQLGGVPVVIVNPHNTSKMCSLCGHTEKNNRKSQSEFVCKACGYATNADLNGANNIRLKGLELLSAGAINRPNAGVINHGKIHECTFGKPRDSKGGS